MRAQSARHRQHQPEEKSGAKYTTQRKPPNAKSASSMVPEPKRQSEQAFDSSSCVLALCAETREDKARRAAMGLLEWPVA
eukprot:2656878-Amphidinium_carterae.1